MEFLRSIPPVLKIIFIVAGFVAFISIISALISSMSKDYSSCNDIYVEVGQINDKEGVCYSINKAALRMSLKNVGSGSIHSFIYVTEGSSRKEVILPRSRLGAGKSIELEGDYSISDNLNVRIIPRVETEEGVISCEDKSVFMVNIRNC